MYIINHEIETLTTLLVIPCHYSVRCYKVNNVENMYFVYQGKKTLSCDSSILVKDEPDTYHFPLPLSSVKIW